MLFIFIIVSCLIVAGNKFIFFLNNYHSKKHISSINQFSNYFWIYVSFCSSSVCVNEHHIFVIIVSASVGFYYIITFHLHNKAYMAFPLVQVIEATFLCQTLLYCSHHMKCEQLYVFVLFHEAAAAAPPLVTTTFHIQPARILLIFHRPTLGQYAGM